MEAVDPTHAHNSKEKIEAALQKTHERHTVYEARIVEAMQVLVDLQKRIQDRQAASRAAEQRPTTVSTSHEGPRFVPREGAPGKLADSVVGRLPGLDDGQLWRGPTTDAQMLTQVKLMLEPGWC